MLIFVEFMTGYIRITDVLIIVKFMTGCIKRYHSVPDLEIRTNCITTYVWTEQVTPDTHTESGGRSNPMYPYP